MKRIVLFLVTNIAVTLVLSVVLSVLGLDRFLTENGINYQALLGFSLVVGFGGSIFSLLISKPMAKWSTGARVIDGSEGSTEYWLVQTVHTLADKAGIGHPEVAIYEGEPNAFATGAFKNDALVAVSSGLLQFRTRIAFNGKLGELGEINSRLGRVASLGCRQCRAVIAAEAVGLAHRRSLELLQCLRRLLQFEQHFSEQFARWKHAPGRDR